MSEKEHADKILDQNWSGGKLCMPMKIDSLLPLNIDSFSIGNQQLIN